MNSPGSVAMVPAAVHHLGHVALRVQDMERAKAFYVSLGLQLCWDAPDWAYLQWPGAGTGLALLSPTRPCQALLGHARPWLAMLSPARHWQSLAKPC